MDGLKCNALGSIAMLDWKSNSMGMLKSKSVPRLNLDSEGSQDDICDQSEELFVCVDAASAASLASV